MRVDQRHRLHLKTYKMKVITKDEVELTINAEIIPIIVTIKHMCDDIGTEDAPIPISTIDSNIFKKIIEFCENHIKPESDEKKAWEQEYVKMDENLIAEILVAANYLDIKPLIDITSTEIAKIISRKSVEEIRELFGIVNDFTPEEEEQIKLENEWCNED